MDLQSIYKNRLPKLLRGNPFWQNVVEAIAEESARLYESILEKKDILNVQANASEKELLEMASFLGYTPDLSLFEDDTERFEQLRKEVQSIIFRIINKSTRAGYEYIFKNIGETGLIYNMFADNADKYGLIRAADTNLLLGQMEEYLFDGETFLYPIYENFAQTLLNIVSLDTGRILDNSNALWYLDESDAINLTKHLAIEYGITALSLIDGEEFLMTPGLLLYLDSAVQYNRKLTEIPHIGGQITIPLKKSSTFPLSSSTDYVVDALKIVGATTPAYNEDINTDAGEETDYTQLFDTIAIGRGVQDVTASSITGLADQINALKVVKSNIENIEIDGVIRIFAEKSIRTNTVTNEEIAVGTGEAQNSITGTLNLPPVRPGKLQFQYKSGYERFIITDGIGRGDLFQSFKGGDTVPIGTIDYSTGEFDFSSIAYLPKAQNLLTPEDDPVNYFYISSIEDINISNWGARPEKVTLSFTTESGVSTKVADNKLSDTIGVFTESGIDTDAGESTINYSTGELEIYFVNNIVSLTIAYQLEAVTEPNDGEPIYANYEVDNAVDITEAGVFNDQGELVAYATFPPFRSPSSVFHFSVQFLVESDV